MSQIQKKLCEESYLITGAKELTDFLRQKGIVTIIHSGNIIPILLYYQKLLGVDYIVGTQPKMDGDTILGISEKDIPGNNFKVAGVSALLKKLSILPEDTVAIGDSPADKAMFEYAGKSIAINPKEGIEEYADFVINNDLSEAIKIIQELNV